MKEKVSNTLKYWSYFLQCYSCVNKNKHKSASMCFLQKDKLLSGNGCLISMRCDLCSLSGMGSIMPSKEKSQDKHYQDEDN
jgi:hypothetical protein